MNIYVIYEKRKFKTMSQVLDIIAFFGGLYFYN